jgi:hypothetical protein
MHVVWVLICTWNQNFDHYNPSFEEWVQRRDALQQAGNKAEAKLAHEKVEEFYDKMYERGYFRDSYNASNVLRLFGLSWWGDVMEMLDNNSQLSLSDTQILLEMLHDREANFEANLRDEAIWEGWTKPQMETYFREKYQRFKTFLEEAITLNEAIVCSI